jgi:hypothetical protein
MRIYFIVSLCVAVVASRAHAADVKPLRSFVEARCVKCHDGETKKGGLDLASLPTDFADAKAFARWVKVHDRVHAGEMPPKKAEQPDAKESAAVLEALASELTKADLARNGAEGRATFRRLTRTEYEYILQDLFGLAGMPLKDELPPDGSAAGFNKVSEALDISHVQIARYMDAAKLVLDRAIATRPDPPKPFKMRYYPADTHGFLTGLTSGDCVLLKDKKHDPALPLLDHQIPSDKIHYYIDTVFRPNKSAVGVFRHQDADFEPGFWKFSPMLPGRYKCRLSVWSFWWDKGEVLPSKKTQVAGIRTQRGVIGFYDAPSLESKVHEFEVWLEPNDVILFNTASMELVHVYHQKGRSKEYQGPGIAVDWLDIEGPVYEHWPTASHVRLFGELPLAKFVKPTDAPGPTAPARPAPATQRRRDSTYPSGLHEHGRVDGIYTVVAADPGTDAKQLLQPFLSRAFRRPVTDTQLHRYLSIVDDRLKSGDCFENAMRTAYTVALCAPEFLFRVEHPGKLDDWAIANRLSLFLWSSLPDDELLDLARRGELKRGGDVVRNQVRRMLKEPRAERFIEDFLAQWLALNEIAATTPDKQLYPEFIPYMQDCMVGETQAYFRHLLNHNLGIAHVVDADFAMLNAELGKLYGIAEAPAGHGFWRVALPPGSHRGGLLTQAAVLKVTANGTLTSPVKRGVWIMDRLLGKPPEPPPPNVGEVDPDLRGATTIRQQLDLHRNHASCASCHRSIDPPGFALESYDVIGRWRERYRSKEKGDPVKARVGEGHYGVSYRLGLPVDCTGETADGIPFKDIEEFKKLLLQDEQQLARNYLRRLAVYATGREVGFADRKAVEAILDKCGNVSKTERTNFGAYRMRSLIEELVASELFLAK